MSNILLRSHAGENISELLYANEVPVFLLIMTHNCRLVLKTCDVIMATTKCQSIQANRELSSSHAQAVKKKNTAKYCGEKSSNCLETFDKILEKQQKLRVRIVLVRKEGFPGKPFFWIKKYGKSLLKLCGS